ncbi:GNAT family N-acetyltransferase [Mycobacterium haemophilum]|uniref:Bifunctional AAC/APH n=1 Tax=Mycobacterium haemophilum TaxID=29311 RepID=A0A0I9UV04_9MYCO|nr:bifunctional GNAT family N-acetyltransferase/aminoglycoside 3'-phosphotransferase/choline kinase family protein [Mycobacterium haemophilum]AKN17920.1 transferase [Mycobacterium haemophilum DSM 44634]KLO33573.1 transferase [Mycobacterium haemophilum]KLO39101.1 transferase [Mycobacterium haemophilum]KLO45515.1 transferase [Mycobacterium haemophilum]KLO56666.1 transferase [Mycobacterium haemophilum]
MCDKELSDGTVTLSPLRLDDVEAQLAGEDDRLVRWLTGGPATRRDVEAYIRHCREQWVTDGPLRSFGIRIRAGATLVGTVDLRFEGEGLGSGQVNVAYGLYPAWRGHGLATRAVDLVCRYATEHGATEAVVKVEPENAASAKVALRAGFAFVRQIREQSGTVFDRYERVLWSSPGTEDDALGGGKMHADEVHIDEHLVRRLLCMQFPRWAHLPVARVRSAGTDNAMYRLGEDMAVRIPRIHWAVESLQSEQRWLPWIAAQLSVDSPVPVGRGTATDEFGWPWSVCRWVPGENPTVGELAEPGPLARDLACFITILRAIDPTDGPTARRGAPLAEMDEEVRAALVALDGLIDTGAATAAWAEALRVPPYPGPAMWFHGDLSRFNILTARGRLTGVIDFGLMGVGDPSVDLIVAWNTLSAPAREQFRTAVHADDDSWARGRGRALAIALIALPYYQDTNPFLAASARHAIREILADFQARLV